MTRTPLKPDSIRTVPGSVLRELAAEIEFLMAEHDQTIRTYALLQRILALLKAEENQ